MMTSQVTDQTDHEQGQPTVVLLDTQSPSHLLLQKLKDLRKWQDQQRAELLRLQCDSPLYPPGGNRDMSKTLLDQDTHYIYSGMSNPSGTVDGCKDGGKTLCHYSGMSESLSYPAVGSWDISKTPVEKDQVQTYTTVSGSPSCQSSITQTNAEAFMGQDKPQTPSDNLFPTPVNSQSSGFESDMRNSPVGHSKTSGCAGGEAAASQGNSLVKQHPTGDGSQENTVNSDQRVWKTADHKDGPPEENEVEWNDYQAKQWGSQEMVDSFGQYTPMSSDTGMATWPSHRTGSEDHIMSAMLSSLPVRQTMQKSSLEEYDCDQSETEYSEELTSDRNVSESSDYTSAQESSCWEPESFSACSSNTHTSTNQDHSAEVEVPYNSKKYRPDPEVHTEAQKADENEFDQQPVQPSVCVRSNPAPSLSLIREMPEESVNEAPKPMHKFLKKGEGTARFGMRPVRLRKPGVSASSKDTVPKTSSAGGVNLIGVKTFAPHKTTNTTKRIPVKQLCLQDMPPLSKPKLLEDNSKPQVKGESETNKHTRPSNSNTEKQGPAASNTNVQTRTVPASLIQIKKTPTRTDKQPQVNPVVNQIRTMPAPFTRAKAPTNYNNNKPLLSPGGTLTLTPSTPEFDRQKRKEEEELSAFERLEELADDSSFSSNSSTVLRLLKKGQHSASSTPLRTPPRFLPQATPLHSAENIKDPGNTNQIDHVLQGVVGVNNIPASGNPQPVVNISEVLEQLKAIVRLEGHDTREISEADVRMFLESFSEHPSLATPEAAVHFAASMRELPASSHPTSTPTDSSNSQPLPHTSPKQTRPHVHFGNEEVEVHEYEQSDGEDTLTDATSLAEDDSDLIMVSEMEGLVQYIHGASGSAPHSWQRTVQETSETQPVNYAHDSSADSTLVPESPSPNQMATRDTTRVNLEPIALQFSPPTPKPKNCASHYIWSIFKRDKDTKKCPEPKTLPDNPENSQPSKEIQKPKQESEKVNPKPDNEKLHTKMQAGLEIDKDIEAYKVLVLAHIAELEKETKIFKQKNARLTTQLEETQVEREKLAEERKKLQEETAREKKKLQEYIDRERNALWKEKRSAKLEAPMLSSVKENSLEIVYLKEQLHDLQEELKRKESLHQFNIKKLNERIRILEEDNKQLKNKSVTLQKENLDLKCKLDRAKSSTRSQASAHDTKSVKGQTGPSTRTKSVDAVNRSIERLTRPQTKVVRESETAELKIGGSVNRNNPENYKNIDSVMGSQGQGEKNDRIDRGLERVEGGIKGASPQYDRIDSGSEKTKRGVSSDFHTPGSEDISTELDELVLRGHTVTRNVLSQMEEAPRSTTRQPGGIRGILKQPVSLPTTTDGNKRENVSRPYKSCPLVSSQIDNCLAATQACTSPENQNLDFVETIKEDGIKEIIYANGTKKEVHPDGTTIVSYYNGDMKEVLADRTVYTYGTDHTKHTTFNDGREVLVFPNGQTETRCPNGSSKIKFPDGSEKLTESDGTEICTMKDGTVVQTNPDGSKIFQFPSGQREVHSVDGERRREWPNGTVKILHRDGSSETRYWNGRRRVRDKEGNLVLDIHAENT